MVFLTEGLSVNKGHLKINGCDAVDLAHEFGTPLYVMNENAIRNRCVEYKKSIEDYCGGSGKGKIIYASKAFSCLEIYRIMRDEGLGIDVVSEGELYTALKANFPARDIHFHGNNKTFNELFMAVKNNVGRIVLDNFCELKMLEKICSEYGKKIDIAMRIKPGVSAHTHEFIRTGQIDSKFGFAIETGEAMRAIKYIGQIDQINLKELHCHIGSQIFDVEPFVLAAQVMMDFISSIRSEIGITIKELNLGGGFGIAYTKNDNPPSCEDYMKFISKAIREKARDFNLPMPYLYLEPGRSIVGEAGVTLYTVGAIKEIPNIRTWVSIDGGMCDNPRYALYRSDYTALIANKVEKDNDFKVTIAGKCCESGDLIQENAWIPKPKPGDIMAIISTGAYNYSMASNYNRIPKPAVVMLKDGKARLIVKRQTLDDLLKNDL